MASLIDPRAAISPRAELGRDVAVGPFTVVEEGAVVGDGTQIAACALIGRGARIGRDCRIHHGAVVGHEPQDLKYAGEKSVCEVGDRTVVRECATLHRGTGEGGRTVIGSDCLLMGYVHVAHDCVVGTRVIMANAAMLAGHCEVGDHATIGGITPVHQFVRIGMHSMIGGGLRVPKDVPPFVLAGQEPLIFQGLNSIGLRRRGFTPACIAALENVYALIYGSGMNVSQALARIREDASLIGVPEVDAAVRFIEASRRGIIAGPRRFRHRQAE
ncbi:MAG: acyl-ACP--UDP-N-acetylglucosamine O-acyltransferase [Bacteroidota bacterium]